MAQSIREVMTPNPTVCPAQATLQEAARLMRDQDIGNVLVEKDGQLCGIVTDRDIVVRGVAEGGDGASMRLGDICGGDLVSLSIDATVDDAVQLMRDKALRRIPVVQGGQAVGVVSIGDLAMEQDPGSALADISAAPPND